MKKISLLFVMFFLNSLVFNAECSYKDQKELNTLATYVETTYNYNEETGKFDLTIFNLKDSMVLSFEEDITKYYPVDGEVVVEGLELGTSYKMNLMVNSTHDCEGNILRILNINLPFINPFYQDERCLGYESLGVCNSRFLEYEVTESNFIKQIEDMKNKEMAFEKNDEIEAEVDFKEKVMNFFRKIYIPFVIVTVTSLITTGIYVAVYRKIKHGL